MATPSLTQISQALNDLLPKLKPAGAVPTGCISHFHTVPDGWLLCNGAAVSRTTYANLFAVIGTKYGSGDGSTTFNLPNLSGRFLESTTSAREVGTMKSAALPNITGRFTNNGHALFAKAEGAIKNLGQKGWGGKEMASNEGQNWDGGAFSFAASLSSSIYGRDQTVRPNSAVLLPCIKT